MDTSVLGLLAASLLAVPMVLNTAVLMFLALHPQQTDHPGSSASGERSASSYQPMIILTSRAAQRASAVAAADEAAAVAVDSSVAA
jgi:hypothetical protein